MAEAVSLAEGRQVVGALPMYADLTLVTAERHGGASLLPQGSFAFASTTPTVPLAIDEFERAALDYPIVFIGPARRAFAVTGLEPNRNLFVDDRGDYRPGAYIPAYLRRHPFALVADEACDRSVLCIDEESSRLVPNGTADSRPLFADGVPAEAVHEVVAFCEGYETARLRTERLVHLLDELDLFEARQAHYQPPAEESTEPLLLLDYVAVSRDRLNALDAAALSRLHEVGGLAPIYAHLLAEANWQRLAIDSE